MPKKRKESTVLDHSKNNRVNKLSKLTTKFRHAAAPDKADLFDDTGSPVGTDGLFSPEPKYNRKKGKIEIPTGREAEETMFHNDPESLSLSMAKMINHNKSGKFKKEALDKYTTGTGRFLNSDTGHLITRAGRGLSLVNSIRSGLRAAKEESKGKKESKLDKHSAWILPTLTEAVNVAREVTNRNTAKKILKDSGVNVLGDYTDSQLLSRLKKSSAIVLANSALRGAAKMIGRKIYKKKKTIKKYTVTS